jgi:hypothetical protein
MRTRSDRLTNAVLQDLVAVEVLRPLLDGMFGRLRRLVVGTSPIR